MERNTVQQLGYEGELGELGEGFQESDRESSLPLWLAQSEMLTISIILGMKWKGLCSQKLCNSIMSANGTTL